MFVARDVPGCGYAAYTVGQGPIPPADGALKAGGTTLESRFYRVVFDEATGTIASLFDKELGRELVDRSAPHGFNQYIYDHRDKPKGIEGYQASPSAARLIAGEAGPVFATMRVETVEPRSGAEIRQTITLYRDLKRVDVADDLRKVRAMHALPRYGENVFLAFPLNVPGATIRAEYAVGTVRPHDDQLRVGTQDYLVVQRYVDCSNNDFGVTWTTREAPVVHFGEIRYNRFSTDYRPEKPWLYSYAMSNRMAGLIWHHPDQCRAELHYTITSHARPWPAGGAAECGWQQARPLVATVLTRPQPGTLPLRQSFVQVDAPNVQLVALKPSEPRGAGFVVRLVETEGRPDTAVRVRFPQFRFGRATLCDLVENDVKPLALEADGQGFRLTMGRYGLATVRLAPRGDVPAKVAGLRAEARSDKAIRLTWQPVPGAASYRVYRLPGPGESACLDALVDETRDPEYLDDWLNLDTTYHYRVAAVAPGNLEGEPADEASARTRAENLSPPAPVRDLVAIPRGSRRVVLTWRSNPETDVTAYEVYRSERPDFEPDEAHRIRVVAKPVPHYRQLSIDTDLRPRTSYYDRVFAVDALKQRSPSSPVSSVTLCDDPSPEAANSR